MPTTDDPLTGSSASLVQFLAADWGGTRRHRRATTSFRTALSLDDMDEVVVRPESDDAAASQTVVLLFKALEQAHGYASAHAAFADGASIVINHVDKAWPPLNALCTRLGERFRYAFANLYFTPYASQTAPPHSDDRDVFVLQMHGAKRWRVWPCDHCDAQLLPFADEQAGKEPRPKLRADELGAPELGALQPGDALYIPRGAITWRRRRRPGVLAPRDGGDADGRPLLERLSRRRRRAAQTVRSAARCRSARCRARRGLAQAFAARWEEMLAVELGDARRARAEDGSPPRSGRREAAR